MSWKKVPVKFQKMYFVADWLKQEHSMSALCKHYGISRQCGYELVNRFKEEGEAAFKERSHSRHTHPNLTPAHIVDHLLETKQRFKTWGPATIKAWLEQEIPETFWPATSTIGDIFKKHGLVKKRRIRKRVPRHSEPLKTCNGPNQSWSADYKGQFRMQNKIYCYPLTITDNYSRYILCCDGFEKIDGKMAIKSFERVFYEYGMPEVIRTDNGYPFASTAVGALTRLSIWLIKLGITLERIQPGHPEQNPRHERMHRTLKESINLNPQPTLQQQQLWFNDFRKEFNEQRPQQALRFKRPAAVHKLSLRDYPEMPPEVSYPKEFLIRKVKTNGEIKCFGKRYFISELLHGESIGLKMIDEGHGIVYFSNIRLGAVEQRLNKITR